MAPVMVGALGVVIPKLGEWLQQLTGKTSKLSVQKNTVLGTTKITVHNPQRSGPLEEDPRLRKTHTTDRDEKGYTHTHTQTRQKYMPNK